MKPAVRAAIVGIAAVATFYFMFWVGFSLVLPTTRFLRIRFLGSSLCALLVARYAWKHSGSAPQGFFRCVALGALATGAIGFSAGFFGPILFTPEANQGPLLGIFITGPLGLVLGAVGGGVYWLARGRRVAKG